MLTRSFENTIARTSAGITLSVMLAFGTLSFLIHRDLLEKHIRSVGERAMAISRVRMEAALTQAVHELESIAANPTTANALVDSVGRDAYLLPFLRNHWLTTTAGYRVSLCDFAGKLVASSVPGLNLCASVSSQFALADLATPRATTLSTEAGQVLALAFPVVFAGTGQPEGTLVAAYTVAELGPLAADPGQPQFHYRAQRAEDATDARRSRPTERRAPAGLEIAQQVLALPEPIDGLGLTIRQYADRSTALEPLRQLAWRYLAIGLLATIGVAFISRLAARRVARPLAELAKTSRQLSNDIHSHPPMPTSNVREVSQLAQAFSTMVDGLRTSQRELEARVTERTAELQASEAHSRAILETALDCIISSDEDGRITEFNPAAERTFGHRRAAVIGRSLAETIIPAAQREAHNDGMRRLRETGHGPILGKRIEVPALHADGRTFPAELAVAPVEVAGRRLYTAYIRDISERKRSESQLREHTQRLDIIFSLSPDGFILVDASNRIAFINPALSELLGLVTEDVIGQPIDAIDRLLDARADPRERRTPLAEIQPDADEPTPLHLLQPQPRILQLTARRGGAALDQTILYFRDVTRDKEIDRMKSEFLSAAAHELRTPMASISGFTELLMMRDYDEATRRDLLSTIHAQSKLLTSMVNELLDLARIEARRGKDFRFERHSPAAIIERTVAGLLIPDDGRQVEVVIAARVPDIHADSDKMQQALSNLLSNAYKYSPHGGAISVELCAADDDERPVRIRVRDQGIGMTAAQLERATERFYRADASGAIPGTGLGLALVKEIIELHGGVVRLDSEIGMGTTVTLELPAATDAVT